MQGSVKKQDIFKFKIVGATIPALGRNGTYSTTLSYTIPSGYRVAGYMPLSNGYGDVYLVTYGQSAAGDSSKKNCTTRGSVAMMVENHFDGDLTLASFAACTVVFVREDYMVANTEDDIS